VCGTWTAPLASNNIQVKHNTIPIVSFIHEISPASSGRRTPGQPSSANDFFKFGTQLEESFAERRGLREEVSTITDAYRSMSRKRVNHGEVIDLTLLEDDVYAASTTAPFELDSDEVELVDRPPCSPMTFFPIDEWRAKHSKRKVSSRSNGGHEASDDEGVVITGIALKHPVLHPRVNCPIHIYPKGFSASVPPSKAALEYCNKCYCYICEVSPSECTNWTQHCAAHVKCDESWKRNWSVRYDREKQAASAVASASNSMSTATQLSARTMASRRGTATARKITGTKPARARLGGLAAIKAQMPLWPPKKPVRRLR
jgi:hypothetical protein